MGEGAPCSQKRSELHKLEPNLNLFSSRAEYIKW